MCHILHLAFHINITPMYTYMLIILNKSRTKYYVTLMCDVYVIVADHVTTICRSRCTQSSTRPAR